MALVFVVGAPPALGAGDLPMLLTPAAPPTAGARAVPKETRGDPTQARARAVKIAVDLLDPRSPSAVARLGLELFDGRVVALQRESLEARRPGDYSWHGFVVGNPESQVVLSVVNGEVAGAVELFDPATGAAQSYRLETNGRGGATLVELDRAGFPEDHPSVTASMLHKGSAAGPRGARGDDLAKAAASADSGATIDVMVVYSNQTAAAAGTAIGAQIQQAVDLTNAIYANSGIATRLRLVHIAPAGYDESGDFYTDLNRLTGTTDGYMDTVHGLRNTFGADLVSLFVENGAYCGLGWVGPSAAYGFTVVNRACAGGNYSFAHELAHNMGALHDPYVDPSNTPYAYGHGFVNATGGWRTVMAYNNACAAAGTSCVRIPYFSNAGLTYGGSALGSASLSDNARVINQNAYTVANFRAATSGTGSCDYALSPTGATIGAAATSSSFGVSTAAACAITAASNASWLTVGATAGMAGSSNVPYAAAQNTGPARSAVISVNGLSFTVTQASGCTYVLSASGTSIGAGAASGTVGLTSGTGCAWSASSSASWLSVTSGSGSGSASVGFAALANTGALRSANLTIGSATFTVTQAAATNVATAGVLTMSTASVNFGNQKVGTASRPKTVTVSNAGVGPLKLASIAIVGANPGDFSVGGTCAANQTLDPGKRCTVEVVFAPVSRGSRSAVLEVGSNGGSSAAQLAGSGR